MINFALSMSDHSGSVKSISVMPKESKFSIAIKAATESQVLCSSKVIPSSRTRVFGRAGCTWVSGSISKVVIFWIYIKETTILKWQYIDILTILWNNISALLLTNIHMKAKILITSLLALGIFISHTLSGIDNGALASGTDNGGLASGTDNGGLASGTDNGGLA